ncbi:MAG: AMP-binding protein [Candidatus Hydrogenedentes bacterium]|nr:AMP-binding protein [Candidatus Hydrogenedentota bacterium]
MKAFPASPEQLGFEASETLPARFQAVAALHPQRLAVRGKSASFSYAECNAYANGIAALIQDSGAHGGRVILYMGHDARLIAAMLGVLKSGNAFVPVDPAFPIARNTLICTDADAALILTENAHAREAHAFAAGRLTVVNLDESEVPLDRPNVDRTPDANAAACLLYTSGSTGKPKGVVHTHQSVLHIAHRRRCLHGLACEDRVTLLHSCSVMGALQGIFTTLSTGAALLMNSLRDAPLAALLRWLNEESVTVYYSVPAVFRALVSQFHPGDSFPTVRLVIFSGERTLRADLENVWHWFPPTCRVAVGLSTTETGPVCGWLLDRHSVFEGNVVPSGPLIPGMEVSVKAEDGTPAPVGAAGEVLVQSRYLFQGYWRQPEQTGAVLAASLSDPQSRIYRTGDIGVMSPTGALLLTGRKDTQLSIRGYRVETGEIESILLQHPGLAQAAVAVQDAGGGESVLAAFLVPQENASLSLPAIRSYLLERLPAHMVPARYAILDALPMTPNQKIDRRHLNGMEAAPLFDRDAGQSPRDDLEAGIAALFAEALGLPALGIDTDFLSAGGSSLMAIRLLAKIEADFGRPVPLSVFYRTPTVAGVAKAIRHEFAAGCFAAVVPLRSAGNRPALFFVLGGGIYRSLVEHLDAGMPVYTVMLEWERNVLLDSQNGWAAGAQPSLDDLASVEAEAILAFQPEGPYCLAGSSFGGKLAFQVAQQLRSRGKMVAFLAMFDSSLVVKPHAWTAPWLKHQLHLLKKYGLRASIARIDASIRPRLRRWWSELKWRSSVDPHASTGILPEDAILQQRRIAIYHELEKHHQWSQYDGYTVLFWGADSVHSLARFIDPSMGWRRYIGHGLSLEAVSGDHLGMLCEPHVRILAEKMNRHLARCISSREHEAS